MAETVYILCALTSVLSAVLLLKSYARRGGRLLFWSGLCFVCLALSNIILFIDLILLPDVDLAILRHSVTLLGLAMLLYGLIWETN